MMLFPFLHIPSIPSPNYVIVVAPTWALPVWTLGLCWTVRPGRIMLGFPLDFVRARLLSHHPETPV